MKQLIKKILVLFVLIYATHISLSQASTTVQFFSGGKIKVTVNIVLYGPGASQELAQQWEQWIENSWNKGAKEHACYDIEIDANFVFFNDNDSVKQFSSSSGIVAGINSILIDIDNWGDKYDGYHPVYVTDGTAYHKDFIGSLNAYNEDVVGGWSADASEGTILHEFGHYLGMDDHYVESTRLPEPGWGNNIMADHNMSPFSQALGGTFSDKMDERNFEEMLNKLDDSMKDKGGMYSCLKLELEIDADYHGDANHDKFNATLNINVTPNYAGNPSYSATPEEIYKLIGSGSGNGQWTDGWRLPGTWFGNFRIINNDFPVAVGGYIEKNTYHMTIDPQDIQQAKLNTGKIYHEGKGIHLIFASNQATCTTFNTSVGQLTLDEKKVTKGMTCEFPIKIPPYIGNKVTLTVKSKMGR